MEDERMSDNHSGIPGRAKALMVLAAIITILAVWLVPGEKHEEPPSLPKLALPPAQTEPGAAPPQQDSGSPDEAASATHQSAMPVRDGDQARAIISELRAGTGQPDPDEIFARAEQLSDQQRDDDAYLLYRFAARQGHAGAALVLGTQADPAFHSDGTGVLQKADPQQAYKWYSVAAEAGNEEAVERLRHLREQVEQSAADGDAAARRLMLQWQ
jgi:TPR repeat protein